MFPAICSADWQRFMRLLLEQHNYGRTQVEVAQKWRQSLRDKNHYPRLKSPNYIHWLVVWNMNFIFPYIGNNHPN